MHRPSPQSHNTIVSWHRRFEALKAADQDEQMRRPLGNYLAGRKGYHESCHIAGAFNQIHCQKHTVLIVCARLKSLNPGGVLSGKASAHLNPAWVKRVNCRCTPVSAKNRVAIVMPCSFKFWVSFAIALPANRPMMYLFNYYIIAKNDSLILCRWCSITYKWWKLPRDTTQRSSCCCCSLTS